MLGLTDPTCILIPPHLPKGAVTDERLRNRIAVHLVTRYNLTPAAARRLVHPMATELFGRLRRLHDGDTMNASSLSRGSHDDHRDATYIRVSSILQFRCSAVAELIVTVCNHSMRRWLTA